MRFLVDSPLTVSVALLFACYYYYINHRRRKDCFPGRERLFPREGKIVSQAGKGWFPGRERLFPREGKIVSQGGIDCSQGGKDCFQGGANSAFFQRQP